LPASLKKGFNDYIKAEDPDILCLQETKTEPEIQILRNEYPYQYWSKTDNRKGNKFWGGVAILSKIKPLKVSHGTGLEGGNKDPEGASRMRL
jgi:exonuclease III